MINIRLNYKNACILKDALRNQAESIQKFSEDLGVVDFIKRIFR